MLIINFKIYSHSKLKFQETASKVEVLQESELIMIFENALKGNTKYEVIKAKPRTLNEAIGIATRYEECCGNKTAQSNMIRSTKVNYVTFNSLKCMLTQNLKFYSHFKLKYFSHSSA